ncbi:MAG: rane protein of unknown function [Candidatus Saccharibacteria bacterium]|nr:rane protein of unknown function [Candidatus Saccharibacteria bacterium]
MNKIKQLIVAAILVGGFGLVTFAVPVGAVSAISDTCSDPANKDSVICKSQNDNVGSITGAVVNTLLFLLGLAAVIVIIIAGFIYVTSSGEAAAITRAKNMILYAVVGLVVAFSAYAIINWVLKAFG